ncbi:FAD-binding domain-containing protein [Eremomyces bilateralis CBS 781.70]|uniref:FAD-binding domain-containing protein n=1 Tax=Eremomyces bilateralis CBS 781.70 TaxID=1392243 RepID=A0A6G1GCN0_9PEZI|nr:FAD-binding domain-containing protein [Eremomyces bilateralis CBS 781.70]KAF1815660.1 FAD-binding domain-containing protein [Eremomyces bilateralis CBS 781.70]
MLLFHLVLFVPGFALGALTRQGDHSGPSSCKCTPKDPCWPSLDEWSRFNASTSGRLIRGSPPAAVCYPNTPAYDAEACAYVSANWFTSSFHAADPISVDYPFWANNSCNPIYSNGTSITGDPTAGERGCSIGKYPAYVVNATTAEQVQATVRFAVKNNIRLNIKNTGHNYPGRSTAYGSLSIYTRHFQGIQWHDDFKPQSCNKGNSTKQMAATIAAGMNDTAVYEEADKHGAVVVGGSNPTVGIMGWFQGGGHGPLSSEYGMGADNLLEATLVTPTGDLIIVNECQHSDVFWAIRGGGGGTFGVLLSATMKAYPTPATSLLPIQISQADPSETGTDQFYSLIAWLHSQFPALKDGGAQGYYFLVPPPVAPVLSFSGFFFFYNKPEGYVTELVAPVRAKLEEMEKQGLIAFTLLETPATPTFYSLWFPLVAANNSETVAEGNGAMGSRLLTRKALTEDVGFVASVFKAIASNAGKEEPYKPIMLGHMIANDKNRGLDIALNPGWRDAVTHFVVVNNWPDALPSGLDQKMWDDMTFNTTHYLRQLSPDSGAYFNEADPFEPDWQYTFFGVNYPRLRKIKKQLDPDSVLWCRGCVGSEEWDEEDSGRLCRVGWAGGEIRRRVGQSIIP